MSSSIIALIPARSGSKRIRDKNIKNLFGHPLLAYTIQSAFDSRIFSQIVVSTDSKKVAEIARYYGAEVPFLRPKKYATSTSPDIEWVRHALEKLLSSRGVLRTPLSGGRRLLGDGQDVRYFAILRPTNPFRKAETIRRAFKEFMADGKADSLRAVERCRQHPGKMWFVERRRMRSVLKNPDKKATPWHNMQYQSLPEVFAQNASLEIAWCYLPLKKNTISGDKIMPFITFGYEGVDINDEKDWFYVEYLIKSKKAFLPKIKKKPYNHLESPPKKET